MTDELRHEYRRFLSDHPGHPLGPGMPMGSPLRMEVFQQSLQIWRGESHLMAWERIMRGDPCAYCGSMGVHGFGARTADHIEPKRPLPGKPTRGLGGAHSWMNLTGACESCNGAKARKSLLRFLLQRRLAMPRVDRDKLAA